MYYKNDMEEETVDILALRIGCVGNDTRVPRKEPGAEKPQPKRASPHISSVVRDGV